MDRDFIELSRYGTSGDRAAGYASRNTVRSLNVDGVLPDDLGRRSICRIDSVTPHLRHRAWFRRFIVSRATATFACGSSARASADPLDANASFDGASPSGILPYEAGIDGRRVVGKRAGVDSLTQRTQGMTGCAAQIRSRV